MKKLKELMRDDVRVIDQDLPRSGSIGPMTRFMTEIVAETP
jgi:hypothetical protein